jgi:hypothetical protein
VHRSRTHRFRPMRFVSLALALHRIRETRLQPVSKAKLS